jgi:hypothetical protein
VKSILNISHKFSTLTLKQVPNKHDVEVGNGFNWLRTVVGSCMRHQFLCMFLVYLTFYQWRRLYSIEWRGNKFERKWKEAVMAKIQGTNQAFAWKDWEKLQKSSVRIADLWADIWTQDLPYMKQECYPLDHDIPFVCVVMTLQVP